MNTPQLPQYRSQMIGRQTELLIAQEKIQQALTGKGQVIAISGAAGVGKSRLVAEISKQLDSNRVARFVGEGQPYGVNTSYLPWRAIWRTFWNLSPTAPTAQQIEQLNSQMQPERVPLLNTVLNLTIPDSPLTAPLDPKLLTELATTLLWEQIEQRASQMPLAFIIEDAHWLDPLSRDLLAYIGRNIGNIPVIVLVIYRENNPTPELAELPHFTEITLKGFSDAESRQLIEQRIAQSRQTGTGIASRILQEIIARGAGSPFYIEEALQYLTDRGLDLRDELAFLSISMPETLEKLVTGRIDRLAETERNTLRIASVIGRLFYANWIWQGYPAAGTPEIVQSQLERLRGRELIFLDQPEPEIAYLFKHAITQQVAYDSLAPATRAELHEQMGTFIENEFPDSLAENIDLLAFHFGHSLNVGKQRIYLRQAGDASRLAYSNEAAAAYYQQLLAKLAEDDPTRGEVMQYLGEVWQITGQWDDAERILRETLGLASASQDRLLEARCNHSLGYLMSHRESQNEAAALLERARTLLTDLERTAEINKVLETLATVYARLGEYQKALACSNEQLRIAEQRGDLIGFSDAQIALAWTYDASGDYDQALEHLQKAIDAASQAQYKRGVVHASNDIAGIYFRKGDYAQALTYCAGALAVCKEIGYRFAASNIVGNVGELYRQLGRYDTALYCYAQFLQISLELGSVIGVLFAVGNIALVYTEQAQYERAEQLFRRTIALAQKNNETLLTCGHLSYLADLYVRKGDDDAAIRAVNDTLAAVQDAGYPDLEFSAKLLQARLEFRSSTGSLPAIITTLENLLTQYSGEIEQAAAHYELWRADHTRETDRKQAADLYQALYQDAPLLDYQRRYTELTGETLPPMPPLPDLNESVIAHPLSLETLLERFERDYTPS